MENILSAEECDELIRLSKDKYKLKPSKIGNDEINELKTSSSTFIEEGENNIVTRIEKRISYIMDIPLSMGKVFKFLIIKLVKSSSLIMTFFHRKQIK